MNGKVFSNVVNQGIASIIENAKELRQDELTKLLEILNRETGQKISEQDAYLVEALGCIDKVRDFISNPEHILGSNLTKHGEVAEHVDVGINNAKLIIDGFKARFTFDGVGRTAPEDFLDGSIAVQSKFYSEAPKTLKGILEHSNKYKDFLEGTNYYTIPKDQYDALLKPDVSEDIKKTIEVLESRAGRSIDEFIKPSNADYGDVQFGAVEDFLSTEVDLLIDKSDINKEEIKKEADIRKRETILDKGPSFAEATKMAGISAAISGGTKLAISIRQKIKSGKKITEFTCEDWTEIGIDTGKDTIKGGISGYSIYGLINYLNVSAPVASGYTTAALGVMNLANKLRKNEIDQLEFIEGGQIVCIDSALSTIGAIVGTGIIPIPVLGAVIGSAVASTMGELGKNYLNNQENKLIVEANRRFNLEIARMDKEMQREFDAINRQYERLTKITDIVFDFNYNYNLRFKKSAEYAKKLKVDDDKILKNKDDILKYFLE